jgi:hypothetical protein
MFLVKGAGIIEVKPLNRFNLSPFAWLEPACFFLYKSKLLKRDMLITRGFNAGIIGIAFGLYKVDLAGNKWAVYSGL